MHYTPRPRGCTPRDCQRIGRYLDWLLELLECRGQRGGDGGQKLPAPLNANPPRKFGVRFRRYDPAWVPSRDSNPTTEQSGPPANLQRDFEGMALPLRTNVRFSDRFGIKKQAFGSLRQDSPFVAVLCPAAN
jgi:hypothetical protein